MSVEHLVQAIEENNEEEVLRLIDEEDVELNDQVSTVFLFFSKIPFCSIGWKNCFYTSFFQWKLGHNPALA